jgi:hypothetical protein
VFVVVAAAVAAVAYVVVAAAAAVAAVTALALIIAENAILVKNRIGQACGQVKMENTMEIASMVWPHCGATTPLSAFHCFD